MYVVSPFLAWVLVLVCGDDGRFFEKGCWRSATLGVATEKSTQPGGIERLRTASRGCAMAINSNPVLRPHTSDSYAMDTPKKPRENSMEKQLGGATPKNASRRNPSDPESCKTL